VIVDAQLHAGPQRDSAEGLIALMAGVGVGAGLLTQFSRLGSDNRFVLSLAAARPDRFGAVGIVDARPPVVEDELARFTEQPGAVGVRIALVDAEACARFRSGAYDAQLAAAERLDVPVFVFCPTELASLRARAQRYPGVRFVVDHLGLPALVAEAGPHVFERLPEVLGLADCDNVAVKCSAAPIHSALEFPFDDLWPHLERVLDAFGLDRVMWGSDINRIGGMPFTYDAALAFMRDTPRLTPAEKRRILGDSLRRWLRWSPQGVAAPDSKVEIRQ
jgi:L-fuconolactonase